MTLLTLYSSYTDLNGGGAGDVFGFTRHLYRSAPEKVAKIELSMTDVEYIANLVGKCQLWYWL